MPEYSYDAKSAIIATSGEAPLILLEINHPDLVAPIRVVGDNQDLTSNGELYTAFAFRVALPDDSGDRLPKAQLTVDNIGRELTTWLELSQGGTGATCTIRQVMRAAPDVVEFEVQLEMTNLVVNNTTVTAQLGFENILEREAVQIQFRPEYAPGLFA